VKDNPAEVQKRLSVLPFSREVYAIAKDILNDLEADPLTRAIMLLYLLRASMFGKVGRGFSVSRKRPNAKIFTNVISLIKEYAKQMREVVFENKGYEWMLKAYDSDETLFYLDPPHVSAKKSQNQGGSKGYYRNEITVEDIKKMAQVLRDIKGYFVLKLDKDNYELIKGVLPTHKYIELDRKLHFYKKGGIRTKWTMVIAYNFG
jgi:DNA adenine methylase